MMRTRATLLVAAVAALALSACGTTEDPAASPAPADTAASGPVTVTDSRGKAVTLKAPATKVVALEWAEAETLVSLGVMPVGVADTKAYATWVGAAKLDPSVTDVGTRAEPSVDAIVALQPELVVMEAERGATLVDQLEKYVPVLVTKGSDAKDNLGRMRSDVTMIAQATGRTAEGEKLLADFDAALADAKKKIADAGAAGKQFAVADGWKDGSNVTIRMFGQGAFVSQIGIQLGLKNAWTGEVDEMWGLGQTDVEGLTVLKGQDLTFLYNASDGDDVFKTGLAGNAIWKSLSFVQQNKLHRMPDGIWTFGGPLSGKQYIDEFVKVYAA
ncbi:iron complex transport system substrate-binding protein [Micromonospora pallida]|uniref:Iron complex transport system substrate-binding protein n=1 Tax=Micromonospora pallida TaxID=145854 RepID=A0A1C6T5V4_9ACTN|nr:iron-siderophore ABC transporter substrate-binding protein [Micromonospora pallida]SCL37141.1 iron complex transport system substrate-binding protein [Micromonospora pallida]